MFGNEMNFWNTIFFLDDHEYSIEMAAISFDAKTLY